MKGGQNLITVETKPCKKATALCDPVIICSEGLLMGSTCGKPRTRYFYDASKHACTPFKYRGCKGSLNNFPTKMTCDKTCLTAVNALPQWRKDRMAHLQFQSQSKSDNHKKMPAMADQCLLAVKYGSMFCNSTVTPETRYYYNHRNGRCRQFTFTGCMGNSNNFMSYGTCIKACMPEQIEFVKSAPTKPCQVSEWSHWGPCSVSCGIGEKFRWRSVLKPAMNGGTECPALFSSQVCHGNWCTWTCKHWWIVTLCMKVEELLEWTFSWTFFWRGILCYIHVLLCSLCVLYRLLWVRVSFSVILWS